MRLEGLGAVDADLAVLVDHLAAVAPQQPMGVVVAVADALPCGKPAGRALGLQRLAEFEEPGGVLRELARSPPPSPGSRGSTMALPMAPSGRPMNLPSRVA